MEFNRRKALALGLGAGAAIAFSKIADAQTALNTRPGLPLATLPQALGLLADLLAPGLATASM